MNKRNYVLVPVLAGMCLTAAFASYAAKPAGVTAKTSAVAFETTNVSVSRTFVDDSARSFFPRLQSLNSVPEPAGVYTLKSNDRKTDGEPRPDLGGNAKVPDYPDFKFYKTKLTDGIRRSEDGKPYTGWSKAKYNADPSKYGLFYCKDGKKADGVVSADGIDWQFKNGVLMGRAVTNPDHQLTAMNSTDFSAVIYYSPDMKSITIPAVKNVNGYAFAITDVTLEKDDGHGKMQNVPVEKTTEKLYSWFNPETKETSTVSPSFTVKLSKGVFDYDKQYQLDLTVKFGDYQSKLRIAFELTRDGERVAD